jgi:hypothetical protein
MAGTAHAASIRDLNFTTDGGLTFAGTLTTDDYSASLGGYLVTGMSGSLTAPLFDGGPVTLIAPGNYQGNDHILLSGAPWVTANGISFNVAGAQSTVPFNLFYDQSGGLVLSTDAWVDTISSPLDVPLATPEPAGATLLAGGLALIGWRARRRVRSVAR